MPPKVIRHSNDVATIGNAARVFCQADSKIGSCTWTHKKDGIKLSSENENKYSFDYNVELLNIFGSEVCLLTIPKVEAIHTGNWTCAVQQCHIGSENMSVDDSCDEDVQDDQEVQIDVLGKGWFGAIASQHVYKAKENSKVEMRVLTNGKFNKCEIMMKGYVSTKVVVDGDATEDECVDLQYLGKICAGVSSGGERWSCILKIETVTLITARTWTFIIQEGYNLPENTDVELVMA